MSFAELQLTMAAIDLTCTNVTTAPRYCRHFAPMMSGAGLIPNHSWKNKLNVGVKTSLRTSCVPAARSLKNGRRLDESRTAGTSPDGALDVDERGSPIGSGDVRPSKMGRNSAGPVSRLHLAGKMLYTHFSGCGNIVGSSSVIPQYDITNALTLSKRLCQDSFSLVLYSYS